MVSLAASVAEAEMAAGPVRSGEVDVAIVDDWTSRLAEEIELGWPWPRPNAGSRSGTYRTVSTWPGTFTPWPAPRACAVPRWR